MTTTRERAINLRDWEARANQAGRLKMLVRPAKPQPISPGEGAYFDAYNGGPEWTWWTPDNRQYLSQIIRCPYGKPGDRLRGREAWALVNADEDGIDDWVDMGPIPNQLPWPGWQVWHRAGHSWAYDHPDDRGFRWRSAITMPRWAVRNWLEITEVRCGRARDMSHRDMLFAGWPDHDKLCGGEPTGTHWDYVTKGDWINAIGDGDDGCVEWFADQYDADHGEGAWERDWVWMIGVKRIEVPS